jgi:hypothetical protein
VHLLPANNVKLLTAYQGILGSQQPKVIILGLDYRQWSHITGRQQQKARALAGCFGACFLVMAG